MVRVVAGRVAARAGGRLPAAAGQPDTPVPDHVQHPEPAGILDEVVRQPVAVVLAGAGGVAAETVLVGREVTGPPLGVLAAVLLAETRHEVVEPVLLGFLHGVQEARRDAAAGGRVVDRAALA